MKLGFISDIHEDTVRLAQAIELLKLHCDRIICLGDTVGYSVPYYGFLRTRDAHACVQMVKENCDTVVVGNHDLAAIGKIPKYNGGVRYPKNWYSLDLSTRKELSEEMEIWSYENDVPAVLDKHDIKFLSQLPEYKIEKIDGLNILLSHYAYPDLCGDRRMGIVAPSEAEEHMDFIQKNNCTIGISGHDHSQGIEIFQKDNRELVKFGRKTKIDGLTWVKCPCVANGTLGNGVAILDTKTLEMSTIPLKTKKHSKPAWANL